MVMHKFVTTQKYYNSEIKKNKTTEKLIFLIL